MPGTENTETQSGDDAEFWNEVDQAKADPTPPPNVHDEAEPETEASPGSQPDPDVQPEQEPDAEQEHEQGDTRTVPLAALKQARAEMKVLKRQQAEQLDEIKQQFRDFLAGRQQPQQAEPEVSYEENPAEFLRRQQQAIQDKIATYEKAEAGKATLAEFEGLVRSHEAQFVAKNPDYPDALAFYVSTRMGELEDDIPDERQRAATIEREMKMHAAAALDSGQSPALVGYGLALARGYQRKTQQPTATSTATTNTAAASKVDQIKQGQAKARSLNGAAGSAPLSASWEAMADTDPNSPDFDKMWNALVERPRAPV